MQKKAKNRTKCVQIFGPKLGHFGLFGPKNCALNCVAPGGRWEIFMEKMPEALARHNKVAPIGLVVMDGAKQLGSRIDDYLLEWDGSPKGTFTIDCACPRFSSGDSKGLIKETVRGMDLYFIADMGNYSTTYKLFGRENAMSPDDHYQDLKRLIQAAGGKAHRITVIMPILYGGRQHRRNYRESLDCAWMLQELQSMGVQNIITFDAHDPRVQNAVPLMGFDNVMPYYQVLKCMLRNFPDMEFNKDNFMVISPDEGAMGRNMYYSSVLGVDMGMFYKRRDFSQVVDGRNPIVAHEYLGSSVVGKDVFVTDDIISSGDSMLDIVYALKEKGARRVFTYATYGIFTNGLELFDKAFADKALDCVLGSNLTYSTPELLSREWFYSVDVSKYIAYIVASLNRDMSVSEVLDPHQRIDALINSHNA